MRLHSIPGGSVFAVRARHPIFLLFLFVASLLIAMPEALAHAVAEGDKGFIQESSGIMLIPFIYMGAKHMMTGYDHLLFLFGVIFFLYRLKDVGPYVTLFAVGHSVTLLFGVLTEISISSYIIDAIIGFSVVYKAMDNLGALHKICTFLQIDADTARYSLPSTPLGRKVDELLSLAPRYEPAVAKLVEALEGLLAAVHVSVKNSDQ